MKNVLISTAVAAFALVAVQAQAQGVLPEVPLCQDRSVSAIPLPTAEGVACQAALSKAMAKFAKTRVKNESKCILKGDPYACPDPKAVSKNQGAALKAISGLAKKCAGTALTGLGSTSGTLTADQAGSCAASQINASSVIWVGMTHGTTASPVSKLDLISGDRSKCQKAMAGGAAKLISSMQKTIAKCIDGKLKTFAKEGGTPDLVAECVGSLAGGVYVAGSDLKTADKVNGAITKTAAKITSSCSAAAIPTLFGCSDATDAAGVSACVECAAAQAAFDFVDATYNETASAIVSGGTIQAAVDAASAGDKILIDSGTYNEAVTIPGLQCVGGANAGDPCLGGGLCVGGDQAGANCRADSFCLRTTPATCTGGDRNGGTCDTIADCPGGSGCDGGGADGTCEPRTVCVGGASPGLNCLAAGECGGGTCEHPDCGATATCSTQLEGLSLVGCGGAQDERPIIEANDVSGQIGGIGRGITANDTPGLTFQSIAVDHWDSDGILSSRCDDVLYRDITGDGNVFGSVDPVPTTDRQSSYVIFPVDSFGVTVEGCDVINVDDAGIYVGRSATILTQFNRMENNVTGIEIENSSYAIVQGNHAIGNSGGILSFMVSGPPRQDHGNNMIRNNVALANNQLNTGEGTVGVVPPGTGIILVADHDTDVEWNVSRDNDSTGMMLLGQGFLVGIDPTFPLSPTFAVQTIDNVRVKNNVFSANGLNADPILTDAGVPGASVHYFNAVATGATLAGQTNNCFNLNGGPGSLVPFGDSFVFPPAVFVSCE